MSPTTATPLRPAISDRLALTLFAAAGIAAFARSAATRPAWILVAACAFALFAQIPRLPSVVQAGARILAWILLAAAVVLGFILMAYPIFSQQTTSRLILLWGYSLAALAVLFLLGREIWPAYSALIPSALGTLLVACLSPSPPLQAPTAIAAAALFVWLALPPPQLLGPTRRWPWGSRQMATLAGIALAIFLTSWGIVRFLPWAQSKVEQVTFERYMAGTTHYSMFSPDSTLGDIGRLKLSKKVVMRVWSPRPQKLRGRVFTIFTGTGWRAESARLIEARVLSALPGALGENVDLVNWMDTVPGKIFLLPGHQAVEAGAGNSIRTKVLQSGINEGMVLLPGQTSLLRIRAASLETDDKGELLPPLFSGSEIYAVVNRRDGDVIDSSVPSPQLLRECIEVPQDTEGRVRELAAALAPGGAPPDACIRHTLDYLARECRYSLAVGAFHSRQPVAEFLFEKKRGYCQYFASAAALLLRLEGVPCRYVTGFNIQEGNRQGDHFVVRELDAHAWVEAYLPGRGWLELDPTPEAEYATLHASLEGGGWSDIRERIAAGLAEISIRIGAMSWGTPWRALWGAIGALLNWMLADSPLRSLLFLAFLLFAAEFARRRRRPASPRRSSPAPVRQTEGIPAELSALIARIDNLWAEQGHARPAAHAPLEHLRQIPPSALPPQIREASRKIVDCFYRCCFGGSTVMPGEIQALEEELKQARISADAMEKARV